TTDRIRFAGGPAFRPAGTSGRTSRGSAAATHRPARSRWRRQHRAHASAEPTPAPSPRQRRAHASAEPTAAPAVTDAPPRHSPTSLSVNLVDTAHHVTTRTTVERGPAGAVEVHNVDAGSDLRTAMNRRRNSVPCSRPVSVVVNRGGGRTAHW